MILTYVGNSNDLSVNDINELLQMPNLNGISRSELKLELLHHKKLDKRINRMNKRLEILKWKICLL